MMFSTWGFKAISGIGKRAATIEDRSIVINLKRKAKGEKIARLRHAPKADFADVASKLARVAKDQMAAFSLARPDLPEALNDRAQDNWEHLFAIADIAGAAWPRKVKQAALSLSGVEAEEPSQNILLLADIRDVFDGTGEPSIRSSDLVAALVAMLSAPGANATPR
jgi:putative DNA primase/helicase